MTVNALHVQTPWLWEGNVFSHVSVILSVHRGGGSHVTITHDALDLTTQGLPDPGPG